MNAEDSGARQRYETVGKLIFGYGRLKCALEIFLARLPVPQEELPHAEPGQQFHHRLEQACASRPQDGDDWPMLLAAFQAATLACERMQEPGIQLEWAETGLHHLAAANAAFQRLQAGA